MANDVVLVQVQKPENYEGVLCSSNLKADRPERQKESKFQFATEGRKKSSVPS